MIGLFTNYKLGRKIDKESIDYFKTIFNKFLLIKMIEKLVAISIYMSKTRNHGRMSRE